MSWHDFEVTCGFGGGEETTRFGPRQEVGSSLYQVDTVACISNKKMCDSTPFLLSSSCLERMALVIDTNILVFDESCSEHLCTFTVDSLIDAFGWANGGGFLVFADRSGLLHFTHIESQRIIFSKRLANGYIAKQCFASITFVEQLNGNGFFELFVVTTDGEGFRFSNLNLEQLNKAIIDKNIEMASKIQSDMKLIQFQLNEYHSFIHSVAYHFSGTERSLLVAGDGDFNLSEWLVEDGEVVLNDFTQSIRQVGFKKNVVSPDGQYIVSLDAENNISLWTRNNFIFLDCWQDLKVDDFNLFLTSAVETDVTDKNSKAKEDLKIVLLTIPQSKKRKLVVLSLPSFDHVYTLTVSECTVLAVLPSQQDIMMFVEGVPNENLDDSIDGCEKDLSLVGTIRVRSLMEAIPQNRFSRLLHKKKFSEAEDFAKMFNLDIELVHKVKSIHILDQLSPWDASQKNQDHNFYFGLMTELKVCLDKIEDMEHVAHCCLQAQLPTLSATYDLLNYAQQKVNFKSRTFTKSSALFQALLDGINRLVTFDVAFGSSQFTGNSWSAFLSSSLLDEVIKCFTGLNVNAGIIIWRRHQSEFEKYFTEVKLQQILHSLENTPSKKIIPWLREDFVPYVLTILPDGQRILACWLEKIARDLEYIEKESWPDNALDLAEVMYKAFSNLSQSTQGRGVATPMQFATKICKLSIPYFESGADEEQDVSSGLRNSMKLLGSLVKSLREVKSLHHEYNCKLSLDQYLSENTKQITFRLLNRIAAAELIPQTIKKYVEPYVTKNNLKLENLLHEYLIELVDMNIQLASLWEPKVIAIINEIKSKEKKCDATLKLMMKAQTPWSESVVNLVSSMLKICPENKNLQRQFQFAELRKMVIGYNIRETNFADISRIEEVVKYMFNTNKPEALEDALKICKHFPSVTKAYVYFLRVQSWIVNNKIYESCKLIEDINIDDAIKVANFCLVWYNSCFQPIDEQDMVEQISITEAVILILHSVSKLSKSFKNDFQNLTNNLKNIHCLQKEFGTFLSITQYDDSYYCEGLIKNFTLKPYCATLSESLEYKPIKKKLSQACKLIRFAELLRVSGASFHSLLIDLYIENEQFEEAFKHICGLIKDPNTGNFYQSFAPEYLKILFKIAFILINASNSNFDWVKGGNDLHAFTSLALTLCKKDSICDYLSMCCLMRFVDLLGSQCESSDYQDDPKKSEGLIHEWILDEYHDDSLVLPAATILPLLQNLVSLSIFVPSEDLFPYDSTRLTGNGVQYSVRENKQGTASVVVKTVELTKTLQAANEFLVENNQQELALQLLMLGVSTCAQHASNLQMGIPVNIESESQLQMEKLIEHELKAAQVILEKGEILLIESCSNLVCSILGHRVVDHDLALCYLDTLSLKEGAHILLQLKNKFASKYNRIQLIAQIGVDFAALQNDINLKKKCQFFKESAVWGRKLQTLRVPPPWNIYSVNSDPVEKQRILEIIVQHKDIDLSSITLYCQSFNFDEEKALLMYIGNLLTPTNSLKPQFDTNYQEKIDEAINVLRSYENLEKFMNNAIIKISPYDYERLAYTFKKIADVTEVQERKVTCEDNIRLLDMLSEYNRTATDICYNMESATMADDLEEEQILLGKLVPPELVKKRLPFHPLIKSKIQWNVLDSELTSEKNLLQLEPIASMLKLNTDQMFAKAVQNIAGPNLIKNQQLESRSFEFHTVENILNMIKNHTVMIAAAKWLAKYLPRGAEKTKVLEAIVKRTNALVSESTGEMQIEATKAQQKFISMYKRVSIEGALIEHGITDEKFFMVSSDAAKLVMMLYEEYGDKAKFETGRLVGAPEIYNLAKAIIEISGDIELQKIHLHLVNKWLPCIRIPSNQNDEDDMMISTSNVETVRKENERNLRRVIYVLASSFDLNYIKMLVMAIYNQESELTNMCRIRALQVLFTLVDVATIKREVQMDIENVYEKLVSCIYLSELENLHISQSEEAFLRCNKEGLVKGLWRNHSREPQGIRLISDICLDYKIFDPNLWNSLLLKLLSFDMILYLTHVLVLLSGVLELREIPSLTKMWRAVIISPFNAVSSPLSAEEEKACLQASQLLTRCPVILDIGLPEIADVMKNAGLFIQSLICIKLIPDQKLRRKKIEDLLDDVGIEVILAKVKKDGEQGLMDGHLSAIEEEIYNYVNEHNLFVSLHGTAHFDKLVAYLIRTQKLNNLLLKTITSGNLKNAVELVMLHVSAHPKSLLAQKVNEGLDAKHALLVYLQEQGLLAETKKYFISHFKSESNESSLIEGSFNNNNSRTFNEHTIDT